MPGSPTSSWGGRHSLLSLACGLTGKHPVLSLLPALVLALLDWVHVDPCHRPSRCCAAQSSSENNTTLRARQPGCLWKVSMEEKSHVSGRQRAASFRKFCDTTLCFCPSHPRQNLRSGALRFLPTSDFNIKVCLPADKKVACLLEGSSSVMTSRMLVPHPLLEEDVSDVVHSHRGAGDICCRVQSALLSPTYRTYEGDRKG